jgi:hypothetical protein
MYVRFTYVDSDTAQPVRLDQPYSGLSLPAGVKLVWAAESEYPTATPNFYGTAENPTVPGILEVVPEPEFNHRRDQEAIRMKRIPTSVSARKAKRALLDAGVYNNVVLFLETLPGPQKTAANIDWVSATTFDRGNPMVTGIAQALGWDESRLDELFVAAERVE